MKSIVNEQIFLIDGVSSMFPETTRGKIRKMLTEGRVLVDEIVQHRAKHVVEPGQTIEVTGRAQGKEEGQRRGRRGDRRPARQETEGKYGQPEWAAQAVATGDGAAAQGFCSRANA